jgi:hypothetical protein
MGTTKGPSEGGTGGKRGHSNMEHWGYTDEVKEESRRIRRQDDKRKSEAGITDHKDEKRRD